MKNLKDLTAKFKEVNEKIFEEQKQRVEIKNSKKYKMYEDMASDARENQAYLLDEVEDSTSLLQVIKDDIIKRFKEGGLKNYEDISAKMRQKKEVNVNRVLEVLGGDLDQLITMTGITQVTLKEFAALDSNKPIKREIISCIEVISEEIADIKITK